MDEEYQVIDDPNDPRLQNTPLNPPDDSSGFDPQAFISGKDTTATEPPPEQPQPKGLPTVTPSLTTFYYPSTPEDTRARGLSYRTEGGTQGGGRFGDIDLRNHTLEKFLAGESDFVAVARKGAPTGEMFNSVVKGIPYVGKWVDTGGGLRDGQQDIATSNPDLARTGIEHGPFDPQAFIKRQDLKAPDATVPDINAFMEPAPTDTPEAEAKDEPSTAEIVGGAISKAASKFGASLRDIPKMEFTKPEFQPPAIPQVPQPQTQVIPGQGMIGAAIPQTLPTPGALPQSAPVVQGTAEGLQQTAQGMVPHTMEQFHGLAQMMGAPTDPFGFFQSALQQGLVTAKTAQDAIKAGPLSKEAGVAYGTIIPQALMMLGGLRGAGAVPSAGAVAKSFIGTNQLPHMQEVGAVGSTGGGKRTYQTPSGEVTIQGGEVPVPASWQPKGLPVKAASVQGLKNPPAIHQMRTDVVNLKSQGRHAEAKALQGQINQLEGLTVGEQPPTPPGQPPQGSPPPVPPTTPPPPKGLNPVPGSGKFRRSYRVDKEMGDQMEGIGAARESGYLRAELQSRNMLHELSKQQEADLGRLLVSDRLKTVNPNHPQVIFDSVARGIESDPAIAKALDYYKKEVKPEIEALRKRAGLSAKAAAGKQAGFISLIVKNPEPLVPAQGGIGRTGSLSRTTRFAKLAEGQAREYSTNLREILYESYSEALKKARVREFYDSTIAKGITEDGTYEELPPQLQHDLTAATQPELNQMPIQSNPNFGLASKLGDILRAAGRGYQRVVTGFALTANPAELMNHMRRQLNIVASKPPVGMGVMARLEALLPYFGPKLGAFKRVVMDDMSTLQNQSILKDIFDAGGGSSRSFGERYESHIPGLEQVQQNTQKLLFSVPRGKGVGGWDLRMRVQLEKLRRSVEGNVDPQRIREFANQIGQYGSHNSWFIRGLRKINPYAATSIPMRVTELKTLFGEAGFKGEPLPKKAFHTAETILRGTGGTLIAMASANYLLSGKWPWQNDAGHEFDINTGVKDKKGKTIYLKERAFAPEMSRPVSTFSVPDVLRERKARHPQYTAAAMTGPANQALSLVSGPGQNLAFTAATGKVPYLLKRPGEGPEFMDVATLKKGDAAQGVSRGGRQLLKALSSINPLGERLASQHEEDAPGALGYLEEPIPGVRPFGDIFSTSYESRSGGGYSRSTSQGRGGGGRSSGRGQGGR